MFKVIIKGVVEQTFCFESEQDQIDFYNVRVFMGDSAVMVDPE